MNMEKSKENSRKSIYLVGSLIICLIMSIVLNLILVVSDGVLKYQVSENIVFFGDSITSHYDVNKFFPKNNVVNKGIDGDKTEDLIDRLKNDVYDSNPSKVFILIGVNDIINDLDIDDTILNIQTIIHDIRLNRSDAKIYIESVYPVNEKILNNGDHDKIKNVDNKRVSMLNKKIKNLCSAEDVIYVDIYSDLLNNDNNLKEIYTYDGLHMTNLGYLKITSLLKNYVQE